MNVCRCMNNNNLSKDISLLHLFTSKVSSDFVNQNFICGLNDKMMEMKTSSTSNTFTRLIIFAVSKFADVYFLSI